MARFILLALIAVMSLVYCRASADAPVTSHHYSIIPLNVPSSADFQAKGAAFRVIALNDRGQVVGAANGQGFLWYNGSATVLGTIPTGIGDTVSSEPFGINNRGQVVGSYGSHEPIFMTGTSDIGSFLWHSGTIEPLPLGGEAYGINDKEQIVGVAGDSGCLYEKGQLISLRPLSTFSPGSRCVPRSINNRGQVAGWTTVGEIRREATIHAFFWEHRSHKSQMHDLGSLPGYLNSYADSVNDRGQIVGSVSIRPYPPSVFYPSDSFTQAFLWNAGKMIGLGYLPGGHWSRAVSINTAGQIVGTSDSRAFLWRSGKMLDLNTLIPANSGWVLGEARAINNKGQIVGNGTLNGQPHAFLLTPRT